MHSCDPLCLPGTLYWQPASLGKLVMHFAGLELTAKAECAKHDIGIGSAVGTALDGGTLPMMPEPQPVAQDSAPDTHVPTQPPDVGTDRTVTLKQIEDVLSNSGRTECVAFGLLIALY